MKKIKCSELKHGDVYVLEYNPSRVLVALKDAGSKNMGHASMCHTHVWNSLDPREYHEKEDNVEYCLLITTLKDLGETIKETL